MLRMLSCFIFFALTACGGSGASSDDQAGSDIPVVPSVPDVTPTPFELGESIFAEPNTYAESESLLVSGFDTATDITIDGGEYAINNGDFTSAAGTLLPTQTVSIRATAPSMLGQSRLVTLTVGGVSDSIEVMSADLTPPNIKMMYPAVNSLTDQPSLPLRVISC